MKSSTFRYHKLRKSIMKWWAKVKSYPFSNYCNSDSCCSFLKYLAQYFSFFLLLALIVKRATTIAIAIARREIQKRRDEPSNKTDTKMKQRDEEQQLLLSQKWKVKYFYRNIGTIYNLIMQHQKLIKFI